MKFCSRCHAPLEEGRGSCPMCFAPVPRGGLFRRLLGGIKDAIFGPPRPARERGLEAPEVDPSPRPTGSIPRRSTGADRAREAIEAVQRKATPAAGISRARTEFVLNDLPPEVREQLTSMGIEPAAFLHGDVPEGDVQVFESSSSVTWSSGGDAMRTYTFKGPDGVERTFERLEDMPPDIRRHFERSA